MRFTQPVESTKAISAGHALAAAVLTWLLKAAFGFLMAWVLGMFDVTGHLQVGLSVLFAALTDARVTL